MLNFVEGTSVEERRRASRFARSCFDAEGDRRQLLLVDQPLEIYGAVDVEGDFFKPENLVMRGHRFAVMHEEQLVATVTVDTTREEPVAVSLEFVNSSSPMLEALSKAGASASREGHREIRVVQIPEVDARFFWVTGEQPEFFDQMHPRRYTEIAFVESLKERLSSKRAGRLDRGAGLDV